MTETAKVLLVEDEALFAKAVCKKFRAADYHCNIAGTLAEAETLLKQDIPDLILLDMRLPDGSGLDFLTRLRESEARETPVIVMTAFGELDDAVAAMKLQALDYLKKPVDLDELLITSEKVLHNARLNQRLAYSRQREKGASNKPELVGNSPEIETTRQEIAQIASLISQNTEHAPVVLITGETGTGKDLAARLLHQQSRRAERPFVHVDCATLAKDLIETELFGHTKGAFTSASSERIGLIEAAEDGTVFLDEIAELPPELQVKLLAVLERHTVRRVGSSRERPVRAWFIAATNRPIEELVEKGDFRADLYFRLKVLTLHLPPLRERESDAVLLAEYFAAQTAQKFGLPKPKLSDDALGQLKRYHWPGNVRELAHLIERAVLLSQGKPITGDTLGLDNFSHASTAEAAPQQPSTLDETEAHLIAQALRDTQGNISAAARKLGITRMALRYRMQKHHIQI